MTASPEEGLQRLMESLERIPEEYSRRINLKKTKVMMFTKGQPRKVSIWLRNTEPGMCTRPSEPRPRRDRNVQNFVRDETETRRCSFRDAGRDLEAPGL